MKIKVSLIIPVYNVEEYLKKCLDSAIHQTLNEIEIIIVNDGSTDKSLSICETYAKNDQRITIISQKNAGLSAARNTGIRAAKGKYLSFLDSDDFLALETLKETFEKAETESLDIVIYRYNKIDKNDNIILTNKVQEIYTQDELKRRVYAVHKSPMACDKLYSTKLFHDNNIYFPHGLYHEDVYITYKLVYYAKGIGVIEKAFYNWLIREGSISKSISVKHIDDILNSLVDMKSFFNSHKVYDLYESEYIRRCYSFSMLMIGKVEASSDTINNKKRLKKYIWKKLKKLNIEDNESLKKLQQIDDNLYARYKKEKEGQGKKMVFKKIINNILPLGTQRREVVKKLIGKKPPVIIAEIKEEKKTNMLDVLRDISKEEVQKLASLKNKFQGQRCFIVGNGPSLNKCDLELLKNEYTFAVNGIFYKTEEMGFKPTFYMVEDGHVVDDNLEKINAYDIEYKFFPSLYTEKIVKTDATYFFAADLGFYREDHPYFEKPRFSKDFSEVAYCGQSVTYLNMQLAYYLGFKEVYLIGMDFSYTIRKTDEVIGHTLVSNEDDINHFHPDYFGKGKKWHDPKVYNVAKNYICAKEHFEENGRKIYNATIGGKLEIFERKEYESLFNLNLKDISEMSISLDTFSGYIHYKIGSKYLGMLVLEKGELSDHRAIIRKNKLEITEDNLLKSIQTALYTLLNHYLSERFFLNDEETQTTKELIVNKSQNTLQKCANQILTENLMKVNKC